ncbi:phage tail tape measure protein [Lactococcus lactis]|uniref:phage tail tape measure protein n=1 Tax=Lactococcus lactis TaxID=1358 RepID=UPI00288DD791|nr:phage tail tape measure protein [Lactococcus lactis]MDT2895515.1 phage tail tape measure protein [Lactococcus lactis]
MSKKEADVVLNFKMDGQVQYAQTIKEINQVMNTAASEYKNQISAMGNDATATEKLTAAKKKLEIQLEGAEKRSQMLREEYKQSVKETGAYSEQSKKLYKQLQDSETGENKLHNSLEQTNNALKEQGNVSIDTAKKLQKIEESGEKIKGAGEKLSLGVTTPILAAGAASAKVANDINTAQGQIRATFGLTEDEAQNLDEAMQNVFDSGLVESIDEAKEAVVRVVNQFPSLKNQGTDAIQSMTEKAIALEQTFDSDMDETLRGANALITTYGISGEKAMDLITVGTQNGLDKTHELGDNLAEYVPQFEQAGYSAEDMFSILQSGLDGGAYNLDKVNDLIKEFGIRMSDGSIASAVQGLGGGFQTLFDKIQKGNVNNKDAFQMLAGQVSQLGTEQEKAAAISAIFGSQGEDAGAKIIESMTNANYSLDKNKKAYEDVSGASNQLKNDLKENATYQSAMNNLMTASGEIGQVIAPYIQKGADAVKAFAQWFKSLDGDTKNWIVTIALLIAAVGPLLVVFGTLMGSVTKIYKGVKTLKDIFGLLNSTLLTNPYVLAIAAIALLVAAFVLAYQKVKWFRDGVNAFVGGIKDIFVQGFNFISGFLGGVFGGIEQNFSNFLEAGKRIFNGLIDFVTGVFSGDWEKAWKGVTEIFGGIFDGIAAFAKAPINEMIGLINGFIGGLDNIKIPKWVPGVGGKSFSIGKIPYLATGGHLINGQAIVGEAGPELLTTSNGKTTVTPLSDEEKKKGVGGKLDGQVTVEQHNYFGQVDANNPSELAKLNRKMKQASVQAIIGRGGVPG